MAQGATFPDNGDLSRLAGLLGIGGRCRRCGDTLRAGSDLCETCSAALTPRTGGYCPVCGLLFAEESLPISRCAECRKSPPPWSAVVFHGKYEGMLADLVQELKYGRRLDRAAILSDRMARAFLESGLAVDVVVPVPLHPKRLRRRGFNQSAVLARPLARAIGADYALKGLRRVRDTPPQVSLPRKERLRNITGAFEASTEQAASRRVLLVDDIMTTGATAREACRALIKAGARDVALCVVARA